MHLFCYFSLLNPTLQILQEYGKTIERASEGNYDDDNAEEEEKLYAVVHKHFTEFQASVNDLLSGTSVQAENESIRTSLS